MAEDWSIDVRKYVPNANSRVIDAIVHYCGIALQSRDSSLVAFNDPVEVGRVREHFLKKKLALTNTDSELNDAIATVGERMKGDRMRNRVTVYYLLAEHFGKLSLLSGEDAAPVPSTAGEGEVRGAGVSAGMGAGRAEADGRPVTAAPVEATKPAAAAAAPAAQSGLMRWLPWLVLAALALLAWYFLTQRRPAPPAPEPQAAAQVAAPATPPAEPAAAATAAVTAAIAGLPAQVNFDLGSAAIGGESRSAIAAAAEAIKRDGLKIAVTGYTDRTGDLPANERLAKQRAAAVRDALVAAGVPAADIEMRPPSMVETGSGAGADAEARRVEISRQ